MKATILFLFFPILCFTQIDTFYYYNGNHSKIRWIVDCVVPKKCELTSYRVTGELMGKAIIDRNRSNFRPSGDAVIYNKEGNIHQEYTYATGTLKTYYLDGKLQSKNILPVDDTLLTKIMSNLKKGKYLNLRMIYSCDNLLECTAKKAIYKSNWTIESLMLLLDIGSSMDKKSMVL